MSTSSVIAKLQDLEQSSNESRIVKRASYLRKVIEDVISRPWTEEEREKIEAHFLGFEQALEHEKTSRFLLKSTNMFLHFMRGEFQLFTPGYYTGIGLSLGLAIGTGLGVTFGSIVNPKHGLIYGMMIGTGLGLVIGQYIGSKKDYEVKESGQLIDPD